MEAIDRRLASLNKYVEELEDEFAESVLLKLKVEDELEEERIKATGLSDQVFDLCQERQDVQMCLEAVSRKLVAVEAEKQSLEDEFAKAEKVPTGLIFCFSFYLTKLNYAILNFLNTFSPKFITGMGRPRTEIGYRHQVAR